MNTVRAREIYRDGRLTLIAVESVDLQHSRSETVSRVYGNLKPIAVVVCSPSGTYALDMEAESVSLEQLRQDVPELAALVGI